MVELELVQAQLSDQESKAVLATKNAAAAESQLQEVQAILEEETRQKMSLRTELRQAESSRDQLKEALEEEDELKQSLEKQV
jgi:hypothetical protein